MNRWKWGEKPLFPQGVITLTGHTYVDANSPRAYLVDEAGQTKIKRWIAPGYRDLQW